jgi:hypothetical protein
MIVVVVIEIMEGNRGAGGEYWTYGNDTAREKERKGERGDRRDEEERPKEPQLLDEWPP